MLPETRETHPCCMAIGNFQFFGNKIPIDLFERSAKESWAYASKIADQFLVELLHYRVQESR